MKPTNDTVKIELEHAPTGNMYAFSFSPHAVPAQAYLDARIQQLRKDHQALIKKHDVPTNKEGLPDYQAMDDEDLVMRFSEINHKILRCQMDALCCILRPADSLPNGYDSKRQLIEECISSYDIIPLIMNFFSKHSGSSTGLPEDGTLPIRFIKGNGEAFDPFPEWTRALRKGSPEKTSSTA